MSDKPIQPIHDQDAFEKLPACTAQDKAFNICMAIIVIITIAFVVIGKLNRFF